MTKMQFDEIDEMTKWTLCKNQNKSMNTTESYVKHVS